MTNQVQYQSSVSSIWWIRLRPAITTLAVGAGLLAAVPAVWSQEEKAAKPPVFATLYTFTGGSDGGYPDSEGADYSLTRDNQGNLFGTTTNGGDIMSCFDGCGVVFKLDRTGKETVLHTFTGPPDGAKPVGGLILDDEGNLFGVTQGGGSGALAAGTVFKLEPNGKETVLHSFTGGGDGSAPYASVVRDEEGNLYGTTIGGGAFCIDTGGCGVVYKLNRAGKETVLYSFTGGGDGSAPGQLIRDKDGTLFGVADGWRLLVRSGIQAGPHRQAVRSIHFHRRCRRAISHESDPR